MEESRGGQHPKQHNKNRKYAMHVVGAVDSQEDSELVMTMEVANYLYNHTKID